MCCCQSKSPVMPITASHLCSEAEESDLQSSGGITDGEREFCLGQRDLGIEDSMMTHVIYLIKNYF